MTYESEKTRIRVCIRQAALELVTRKAEQLGINLSEAVELTIWEAHNARSNSNQ